MIPSKNLYRDERLLFHRRARFSLCLPIAANHKPLNFGPKLLLCYPEAREWRPRKFRGRPRKASSPPLESLRPPIRFSGRPLQIKTGPRRLPRPPLHVLGPPLNVVRTPLQTGRRPLRICRRPRSALGGPLNEKSDALVNPVSIGVDLCISFTDGYLLRAAHRGDGAFVGTEISRGFVSTKPGKEASCLLGITFRRLMRDC
jgi:hypothetical protein